MARAYRCRPSELFGIGPDHAWLAYCIDRAAYWWGTFIEGKIKETKRVPAPQTKHERPMIEVPKYTPEQIRAMLRDDDGDDEHQAQEHDVVIDMTRPDLIPEEPDAMPRIGLATRETIEALARAKP
jgi:hypothetical protein